MKYYKFSFEDTNYFLELDCDNYCVRAIFQKNNVLYNTYLFVNNDEFSLPEGNLFDSLEYFDNFTEKEFEILWKKSVKDYENKWESLKKKFHIGDIVQSKILCFYPQGIISNFGAFFNALSDYNACKEKFGKENMYPNNELELKISEFDDKNKIVKLQIVE